MHIKIWNNNSHKYESMSFIEFKNVCKKYPGSDKNTVEDFNLNIEEKEFIAFVGPSGCGKSTTLRMIAGFEEITGGEIYIDGKKVNEMAPRDRGIAMVNCAIIMSRKTGGFPWYFKTMHCIRI